MDLKVGILEDSIRRVRSIDWGKTYNVAMIHNEDLFVVCLAAELWLESREGGDHATGKDPADSEGSKATDRAGMVPGNDGKGYER